MKKLLFILLLIIPSSVNAFNTSATSSILMDTDTNHVIYGNNIDKVRSVASISKIMTAIVAIESNKLNEIVIIDESVLKAYGSAIYLQVGEEITLENLIYGLMLRSGNDASIAIANHIGGNVDGFVKIMNEYVKKIGMKNTIFNNPNGLDDKGGNLSTAYDMAILTSYAMENDIYRKIVSTKKHIVKTNRNKYTWDNKHKLLNNKFITGGKTGFTDIAKRTLVTTATKDNVNLVAVTLNDGNDFQDHLNLFNEAFNKYTNYRILKSGNITILNEDYYKKDFYIKNDYFRTLENKDNKVLLKFKLDKFNYYKENDKVGIIEVIVNNEKVHEEDIFIKMKTQKFLDLIKKWFKNDK